MRIIAILFVFLFTAFVARKKIGKRNPYGDELRTSRSGFGSDVSSQRTTPFEEEILKRAAELKQASDQPRCALDLFSGYCAANAIRLAELGFTAYAIDFSPPDRSLIKMIGHRLPGGGILHYLQQDARELDLSSMEGKLDLVTAQRGLHFLHFDEARQLVLKLAQQLKPEASMYFSIGATDCAVGAGYKHAHLPVAERWHPLEPELGDPIHVTEPLCLYRQEDIHLLFSDIEGHVVHIGRDDFGLFVVEFKKN